MKNSDTSERQKYWLACVKAAKNSVNETNDSASTYDLLHSTRIPRHQNRLKKSAIRASYPRSEKLQQTPLHICLRRLPTQLLRVEVVRELTVSNRFCGACQKPGKVIGQKIREQFDIQAASVRVIHHVQPTWCCSGSGRRIV